MSENKYFHENLYDRCWGCEFAKIAHTTGYSYIGCFHDPHHGEWVIKVKDCPKKED